MESKPIRIGLGSFDLVKGVAMILTVLGHLTYFFDTDKLPWLLPLFVLLKPMGMLMPMFFIISGYGFREKTVKQMWKLTFKSFIVPYLWVAAAFTAIYPVTCILAYGTGLRYTAKLTLRYLAAFLLGIPKSGKVILGFELLHCSAVWFFLASFLSLNLLNLIVKVGKTWLQWLLTLACVLAGYVLIRRDINFYCIPQGLMAVGCSYLGLLIKGHKLLETWGRKWWLYAILIPIVLLHSIFGHMNLCLGQFQLGIADFVGSVCTAVLFLFAGVYLDRMDWRWLDWIRQIGVYTYWILCIHVVEDGCMQWGAWIQWIRQDYLAFGLIVAVKAVLIWGACFALKRLAQYRYKRRKNALGK